MGRRLLLLAFGACVSGSCYKSDLTCQEGLDQNCGFFQKQLGGYYLNRIQTGIVNHVRVLLCTKKSR